MAFCKFVDILLNDGFCKEGTAFDEGFGSYFLVTVGVLIPIISKKSKSIEFKPTYFFYYTLGIY